MALAMGMMDAGYEVRIFALGDIYPISYKGASVPVTHIQYRGPLGYWTEILRTISDFSPTHIHAFDNKSYFFARLAARALHVPAVLTRPGGPNPSRYFPHARDVVAFSEENASFFRSLRKLKESSVHLIPNRVTDFDLSLSKETQLRQELEIDGKELIVLRICRVSVAYEESVHQAANLTRELNSASIPARLVVIGLIQDQAAFERLKSLSGIRVDFVTKSKYTFSANELIGIGDIVVGVGRGFMEAALHGRILLAPVAGCRLPALATAANMDSLAKTNFSPRGAIPDHDEDANFLSLLELLRDSVAAERHSSYIRTHAQNRFAVSAGVKRHADIYNARSSYTSSGTLDHILNFIVVARFYLPVTLRLKRKGPASTND